MKLQTFFDKFELFADAPNAVQKMRELVLELAIQAKLVEQISSEGDASQVLTEINRERDVRSGQLRKPAEPLPNGDGDHKWQAPSKWKWTQLGSIALQIQYGYTASADPTTTEIRMLRITDIQNNKVDWPSVPGCQIESNEAEKYLLAPNDILIARTGGTIGKSFIVPDAPVKSIFASYLIRVTPPRSVDARYLKIFLESPFYWSQLREMSAGTGQPNVNGQALGRLDLPLPPLTEQKRIVAKVDELMALCDRLAAQQQQRAAQHSTLARAAVSRFADAPTPANLDFIFHNAYAITPADLRKTILTLAVQGKLVHRIASEGIGADILNKAGVVEGVSEDVPDLPAHWVWARLGSVATRMDSGWSPACMQEPANKDEWGVLKTTAVQTLLYQEEQNKALPPALTPRPENEVIEGDILFTRAGPMNRVGILCVARPRRKRLMISDKIIRFHLVADIDPDFAALSMSAGYTSAIVEGLKSGMAASQVNISQPKLRSVPLPLPPLAEQRRIVAKVDELMKLVDQLEQQLKDCAALSERLLDAAVHEVLQAGIAVITSLPVMDRAAIGCYALKRMQGNPSFARTAEVKVLYLAEAHLGLSLGGQYHREAAGPFDKWIYDFERQADKEGWFKTSNERLSGGHNITRYQLQSAIQAKVDQAAIELGEKRQEFDRLLDSFKSLSTEDIEVVATLFAAWNDALIDGEKPNDNWIVREVRENWHPSKKRFSPEKLTTWLSWMRSHGLVPVGKGRRTVYQPGFELVD